MVLNVNLIVLEWKIELWAKAIDPWLSSLKRILLEIRFNSSFLSSELAKLAEIWLDCYSFPQIILSLSKVLTLLFPSIAFILVCWLLDWKKPSLVKKRQTQFTFFVISVNFIYLPSINHKIIINCFFEY